jgi:DNA polymerase-4
MGHSYTLPSDTWDLGLIRSYILMLCQRIAERLRFEHKTSRTVVLTIKYSDFETLSRRKTVDYLIESAPGIYRVCLKILESIGDLSKPVRMLGVSVTSLTEELSQLYLLKELEEERKLHEVIGEINSRFGDFTIKPASLLLNRHSMEGNIVLQ